MTSQFPIAALAVASLISGLLLWLSHEQMRSDWYRDVHPTWRYAIGIICGIVGVLVYGLLSSDWWPVVVVVALYCPGGALIIALYGTRSIARDQRTRRAQADAWRNELVRSEHDAHD